MGTCSFQIRDETFFCKVKSKIPDFERGKSRDCAETYIWYVAQGIPPIDPRGIGCAFHRAGAEIAKKGHFWLETI